uniref:Uncharacterized protein n=1 Tax=Theileria annulata TaxID=5874 RepID=A0A3B0NF45_THEAN
MSQFTGRGHQLDRDSSLPFSGFRFLVRFLYFSVVFQASVCYIFFSLGVLFSLNSFHNHMIGLYAFVFGILTFLYNIPFKPVKDKVLLFFPKLGTFILLIPVNFYLYMLIIVILIISFNLLLEEDIVKHTLYFLIGIPGVGNSDSFQYQLGSILFSLLGFIGTLVSFRHKDIISSFLEPISLPQQEP